MKNFKLMLAIPILVVFCHPRAVGFSFSNTAGDSLADYYFNNASSLFERAEYDSAIFYFEKVNEFFYKEELWERYVESLNHIIFSLRESDNLDSSKVIAEYTLRFADSTIGKQNKKYAQTLNELGRNYDRAGQYDKALEYANQSLDVLKNFPKCIEQSENYSLFGSVLAQKGEYDSSLAFYNKSLKIKKELLGEIHYSVGVIYNDMALVYNSKWDPETAIEYLHKCLDVLLKTVGENYRDLSTLYNNIGLNYFQMRDIELALEYYQKAIYIDEAQLEPKHFNLGLRYANIAMAFMMNKEYDKAIDYTEKALDIFKEKLSEKHPYYAGVMNNLGSIYSAKGDYNKSLELYQIALSLLIENQGVNHPTVSHIQHKMGDVYLNLHENDKALAYSHQALEGRINVLSVKHPKVAETYKLIGDIYLRNNEIDSALYAYEKSIMILEDASGEGVDISKLHTVSSQRNFLILLSRKANAYFHKYKMTSDINDLTEAFNTYEICIDLITKLRQSYKTESAKLSIEESAFNIFENSINTAKFLFDVTGDKTYLEKTFEIAERSKAGVLLDALYDSDAKRFSGIPDSLLEKERQIRVDLSYYDTQIQKEKEKGNKTDSLKLKALEESFFSVNRKNDDLLNLLKQNHPEYFNIKYRNELYTVKDIQSDLLNEDEALIEYFTGDSSVFIFTIAKNNFSIETVANKSLNEIVRNFRNSLSNLDFEAYLHSGYEIYSILIKPIEDKIDRGNKLYIFPDGILNHLPFEALLTTQHKSDNPDFPELNYLINKYEISYFFSAATLLETKNKKLNNQNSFAGFAPVFPDDEKTKMKIAAVIDSSSELISKRSVNVEGKVYSALPETEKEVNEIFNLYNEENIPAQIFVHSKAKESIIKSEEVKNKNILHIASHGFINENKPKLSGILFWIDEKEKDEDGILYSGEIYNLNLNADLVVLSACESGLGKIVKGEGLIGLTRGFIYSGARNILVSLWQVADKSTSELMIEFYKNVLEGKRYSSSLREAKLKLIKDGVYSYPLEWSPFVLIGN